MLFIISSCSYGTSTSSPPFNTTAMDKLSKATYPLLDRIFNKRDSSRRLYGLGCEKHKRTYKARADASDLEFKLQIYTNGVKARKRCRKCSNLPSYSQPDAAYHLCPEQCDGFYSINDSNNDCRCVNSWPKLSVIITAILRFICNSHRGEKWVSFDHHGIKLH